MKNQGEFIVFIVGKSGSGKDAIMRETVIKLSTTVPIIILQRVITRPPDENEDSIYMNKEEFLERKDEFALSWFIYENWYGCSKSSLDKYYKEKKIVLINISREILYEARKIFPLSKIVLIKVPEEIAKARIIKRGREKGEMLNLRLKRIQAEIDMPTPDKVILNDGELNKAVHTLAKYLEELYHTLK